MEEVQSVMQGESETRFGDGVFPVCTRMVKEVGHRLRELDPAAIGSQVSVSRNLGPAFLPSL